MFAFGETYISAMQVPIAIRKWLIKRWNKQKEQEQKAQSGGQAGSDTSQPLSPAERMKMIRDSQRMQSTSKPPPSPGEFLGPTRNNS